MRGVRSRTTALARVHAIVGSRGSSPCPHANPTRFSLRLYASTPARASRAVLSLLLFAGGAEGNFLASYICEILMTDGFVKEKRKLVALKEVDGLY